MNFPRYSSVYSNLSNVTGVQQNSKQEEAWFEFLQNSVVINMDVCNQWFPVLPTISSPSLSRVCFYMMHDTRGYVNIVFIDISNCRISLK